MTQTLFEVDKIVWRMSNNLIIVALHYGHRELIICPIDSNGESLVFDSLFCISDYM